MDNCIFCKIVKKEAPASILFEDEDSMVIEPSTPVSRGHALVIPKKHFVNILDVNEVILAHLARVAKKMGIVLLQKHDAQAMNLLHAAGAEAQQSVFHFHFHIVPRYMDDGLDLWFRNTL